MVQAPTETGEQILFADVKSPRAASFTSSPLRASSSARHAGSDSESSDRSEPIRIPIPASRSDAEGLAFTRSPVTGRAFSRPSTFTPASQAGTLDAKDALDAPYRPEDARSPPPTLSARTSPVAIKSRRRSSASLLDLSSHSPARLVGSYEQSLLSGRMSALPSRPLPFQAELGILGGDKGKGKLKMPPHLHFDFGAVFYGEASSATASPYVGALDLEQHYLDQLMTAKMEALDLDQDERSRSLPRFPGYRLPSPTGQIQLVIKSASKTPIRLFLVPYDLSHLRPGQKTFIRQKLYLDEGQGSLQHAIHLPFCSPPRSVLHGRGRGVPRIYLHGTIRIVFQAAATAGTSSKLHTLYDQPEPSDYAGPSEEWLEARRSVIEPSPPVEPFDPDGADVDLGELIELTFARRPVTPSTNGMSGLSSSRSGTPKLEDALR